MGTQPESASLSWLLWWLNPCVPLDRPGEAHNGSPRACCVQYAFAVRTSVRVSFNWVNCWVRHANDCTTSKRYLVGDGVMSYQFLAFLATLDVPQQEARIRLETATTSLCSRLPVQSFQNPCSRCWQDAILQYSLAILAKSRAPSRHWSAKTSGEVSPCRL